MSPDHPESGGGAAGPDYRRALSPDQRTLYDAIAGSQRASDPRPFPIVDDNGELAGPFKQLLLSPSLGGAVERLGAALRSPDGLSARARELAILLVATYEGSDYEWRIHAHRAGLLGFTANELERLADGNPDASSDPTEQAVGRLVAHLLAHGADEPAPIAETASELGAVVVFELIVLVGYYRMLAVVSQMDELFEDGPGDADTATDAA